jgi:thioesterase domain-containing protein
MDDIAASLVKQIRELHPDGPYYLGGLCGGGLMAYAIASQLMAQGQQVALLALFEPHTGYCDSLRHSKGRQPDRLYQRIKFHLVNLQQLKVKEARTYIRDHIRERTTVYFRYLNRLLESTFRDLGSRTHKVQQRNIRNILDDAYREYRPQPFTGQVTLFQATHREPQGDWERQYWAGLAATLEIHEIAGYSNWLVRFFIAPGVDALAKVLGKYLPEAQEIKG